MNSTAKSQSWSNERQADACRALLYRHTMPSIARQVVRALRDALQALGVQAAARLQRTR